MNDPSIDVFDRDALSHGSYVYTNGTCLSSRLATQRSAKVILELGRFEGRSVLDIGCGDGFYSFRFWDDGQPRVLMGVDAARQATDAANRNKQHRRIHFVVGNAHSLPYSDDSFDLVLIQSILHHDDDPQGILREAFRLAPEILIHEPNGYNLGLKIIERTSPYHREHGEKSYTARQMIRWVEQVGGRVLRQKFAGFVPMFCPDWLARTMKSVEPAIERTPILRSLGCAVYVLVARRTY